MIGMKRKHIGITLLMLMILCTSALCYGQALDRTHVNYTNPLIYGATCTSATLNAAITAVSTTKQTLFITRTDRAKANCTWTLTTNVTFAANTVVYIPAGVVISPNSGVFVTFNGPVVIDDIDSLQGAGQFVFNNIQDSGIQSYGVSGCNPSISTPSASLVAFTCTAGLNVRGKLFDVTQSTAAAVGPFNTGDGQYWVLFDFSKTRAISGWTRQAGTHYLWQKSATQPSPVVGALQILQLTVATNVTVSQRPVGFCTNALCQTVSVKDSIIGAAGDGTTDDAAAMNLALSMRGAQVYVPSGVYLINSNLVLPTAQALTCEGWQSTRFNAGTGVTNFLQIDATVNGSTLYSMHEVNNCSIYGNVTTDAKGIVIGVSTVTSHIVFNNVFVRNFTGTNAKGIHYQAVIKSQFYNVATIGNTINEFMDGSAVGGSLPTTLTWVGGISSLATDIGTQVKAGALLTFINRVFESNAKEGLLVNPDPGQNITELMCEGCWFEDNWHLDPTHYQVVVSATGASSTARVSFTKGFFVGDATTAKSIRFSGQFVVSFQMVGVQVPNLTGQIECDTSAYGGFEDWPLNLDYYNVVVTASGCLVAQHAAFDFPWIAYTPVFSSDIGNSAATFSSTTVTLARYKIMGKTLFLQLTLAGVTKAGVTPAYIGVTLPSGLQTFSNAAYTPCGTRNDTYETGLLRADGGGGLQVFRAGNVVYSAAVQIAVLCSVVLELQ